jgi:hypothetical protein
MTWKLYAVVSAGAFLATYLVSTPTSEGVRPAQSGAAASARQTEAAADIQQLADRLHVRVRSEGTYREPRRDPFNFYSRPQRVAAPAFVPPPVVSAAPVPVLPSVTLSGIASDTVDGTVRRSAVLSIPAGVLIVREGESVGGLYTVVSIAEESIELEATSDGSRRSLRLSGR